jgi:Zn-dependent metalloprotease
MLQHIITATSGTLERLTGQAKKKAQARLQRALTNLSINNTFSHGRLGFDESTRLSRQAARAQRLLGGPRAGVLKAIAGGQPNRTIRTAKNKNRSTGPIVRAEGDPATGDVAVNEAYDYMGTTYDFYWNVFNRNSIDDEGMGLNGTVHYSKDYDNAYWDGQRMIYGDGDLEQFDRFTKCIDVIGHELTHGVTQDEAGLIYWGQTGALNESISDVFGSLVKQYSKNQTAAQADWLIGQGLFMPSVKGQAIRSMKAPGTAYNDPVLGKDPQPADMAHYVETAEDNGGVHTNSGIPNHAFYLAAVKIGGYAWETVGAIWYETLLRPDLTKVADFATFAELTVDTAELLFPSGPQAQAVADAWNAVGVAVVMSSGQSLRMVR